MSKSALCFSRDDQGRHVLHAMRAARDRAGVDLSSVRSIPLPAMQRPRASTHDERGLRHADVLPRWPSAQTRRPAATQGLTTPTAPPRTHGLDGLVRPHHPRVGHRDGRGHRVLLADRGRGVRRQQVVGYAASGAPGIARVYWPNEFRQTLLGAAGWKLQSSQPGYAALSVKAVMPTSAVAANLANTARDVDRILGRLKLN